MQKGSQPQYNMKIEGIDIMVPTRDDKRIAVDIYRPDAPGKFPALFAFAFHNKILQGQEVIEACNNQPAWSPLWTGPAEGGDSKYFTSRGYVHVIGNQRGYGNSSPGNAFAEGKTDAYDVIEWIAQQPWCDGNVGMVGISAFGFSQMVAAMTKPPHLKAIFPYDPRGLSFRDFYPGGVLNSFWFHLSKYSCEQPREVKLTPQEEELFKVAFKNPDYRMYPHLFNLLERKGQLMYPFFKDLIYPYEPENSEEIVDNMLSSIEIPFYTGSGWYAYTYKRHLYGSLRWWQHCKTDAPRKLMLTGPAHLPRPWTGFHDEVIKWYDYWLKGIDTGIMEEPRVKVWTMGANQWTYSDDWPLPETKWTKLYLDSWERMRWEPFAEASSQGTNEPDCFAQMPLKQTRTPQKLAYMTEPLPDDLQVTGPLSLHFWAELDQEDTNWIVVVKDVGPDYSVQTARPGEIDRPQVFEREVTRGWLKASHRAVDESKSLPGQPYHPFTEKARQPVTPGEICKYDVEISPTSNLFKKDHRICIEIMSLDVPTGIGGDCVVEYVPWHICSSSTVIHKVYRSQEYPSHLMLPVIPEKER